MKKRKILFTILILFCFLRLYSCDKFIFKAKEKLSLTKSFEEAILSKFKEKSFNGMLIRKGSDDTIRVDNVNEVKKLLNYFNGFKVIKYYERHLPVYDTKYTIRFHNDNTYEDLWIYLDNSESNFIEIYFSLIKISRDEEKKVTKYSPRKKYKTYKIYDDEIDLKYIEKIFNSLDT
ncbi:MAG: hypothetical protein FH753_06030 [Firmicutes bacterium]|nr:hypothetical protein [Bacillota bacterium]